MIIPGFPGATMVTPDFPTTFVADASNAILAANSVVVAKPTGTLPGDFMIAIGQGNTAPNALNAPAGWSISYSPPGVTSPFYIWRKVAGGSEPSSYTFAQTDTSNPARRLRVSILTYRGQTVINQRAVASGHDAPSITPTLNGTLLAIYTNFSEDAPISGPILMNLKSSHGATDGWPSIHVYDKYPSSTSPTGDKTAVYGVVVGGFSALAQIA